MLNRRQFLTAGSRAFGAWLVGAEVARSIIHLAEEDNEPYLVKVEKPKHVLWATYAGDEYVFSLDCSYGDIAEPQLTWRQWLDIKGVDVSKENEIRDYLEEWGWYEPDEEGPFVAPDLEVDLPQGLLQNYIEWEFTMRHAPTAQAFHYLRGLDLANRRAQGEGLGRLEFVEGPCPGNNSFLVSTKSVALVGGLQQRLLELGERVSIETDWL